MKNMKSMNDEGRSILRNVLKAAGPDGGLELTDIDILSIINNVMYISHMLLYSH